MRQLLEDAVLKVAELLAARDYHSIEALTRGVRLDARTIERAIRQYGRTIVMPPTDALALVEVIEVLTAGPNSWSVTMPLWTAEEGRSDLTAEMTIAARESGVTVELDDIHVL